MHSQTIPSEQWLDFMDEFSRSHLGWTATIEMLDGATGVQKAAEGLALQGISFDTKGTRPSSIQISLGDGTSAHVAHTVDMPFHIRTAEDHQGNIHLQIEPAVGAPTLLHLRAPVH